MKISYPYFCKSTSKIETVSFDTVSFYTKAGLMALAKSLPDHDILHAFTKTQHSIGNRWVLKLLVFFPIYLLCASSIYWMGVEKVNLFFYQLFVFLHIPVSAPTGWNFSAFLAIMFNFIIFYPFMKYGCKTFWIKRFVRYSTLFTYIALPIIKLAFLCSTYLGMWGAYSVTDFRITKCQIMLDLCILRRGDFFLYSSLGVYITSFLTFLSLFLLVFGVVYPKIDNKDFYITLTGEKP